MWEEEKNHKFLDLNRYNTHADNVEYIVGDEEVNLSWFNVLILIDNGSDENIEKNCPIVDKCEG